jgi:hypothetical protein
MNGNPFNKREKKLLWSRIAIVKTAKRSIISAAFQHDEKSRKK